MLDERRKSVAGENDGHKQQKITLKYQLSVAKRPRILSTDRISFVFNKHEKISSGFETF